MEVEELTKLIENFEVRNNISVVVSLYSDGSNEVEEFWDKECLYRGNNEGELIEFLKNSNYKLDEEGRCISPVEKIRIKPMIKTVYDFNEVATDILDNWIEDFKERPGLTRKPDDDDFEMFGDTEIQFIYTQRAMNLYDRACKRLHALGKKMFPDDEHNLDIESSLIIFP